MGLTKQYLRYSPAAVFGIIGSTRGGISSIAKQKHLIASACAENVIIWNIKTGEKVATLQADKHEVRALCSNSDGSFLAVGYNNGSILILSNLRINTRNWFYNNHIIINLFFIYCWFINNI